MLFAYSSELEKVNGSLRGFVEPLDRHYFPFTGFPIGSGMTEEYALIMPQEREKVKIGGRVEGEGT